MRMISIILAELGNDKLKYEEKLQRLINSKEDIDETVSNIKDTLREIATLNEMINLWTSYTTIQDNNNNVGNEQ